MAVSLTDVTQTSASGTGVTTLTTPAMTITSNANSAGLVAVIMNVNSAATVTGSLAGTSGTVVTGTDTGTDSGYRNVLFSVIAPASGSQTATGTSSTSCNMYVGAIATSGVNQTTPFNNGTKNKGAAGPSTITITSTNGDLTIEAMTSNQGGGETSNQTQEWFSITAGAGFDGGQSIGPGTGNTTHTWNLSAGSAWQVCGCNFNQAASGADPIGSANIVQSVGRFIGWTT